MSLVKKIPKIVVVGGGAGGLPLATILGKKLGKKGYADIHLVDISPTHIWKPLLHEVAAGTLDSNHDEINFVTHGKKNGYSFHLGEICNLDKENKKIKLSPLVDIRTHQEIHTNREMEYDYLVLALGAISNNFHIEGIDEYCFNLDTRNNADYFHDVLLKNMIKIMEGTNQTLDIAIMGGGATGVELAAELVYSFQEVKKLMDYNLEIGKDVNITLIEAGKTILNGLSGYIQEGVSENLEKLKIKLETNRKATKITKDHIELADGGKIKADIKVWACGILSQPIIRKFGLQTNRINQIISKKNLQTIDYEFIFAMGDCAQVPLDDKGEKFAPARASNSLQQAYFLTNYFKNIAYNNKNKNQALIYKYKDYGSLISVSKFNAFGKVSSGGRIAVKIDGINGRFAYWTLYQRHLYALYGWFNFWFFTVGSFYSSRVKPRIKLH